MAGKAQLIIIIGFTMLFVVMGYLWSDVATRSVDNHTSYYNNTIAHNIAVSGANIGLQKVIADSNLYGTLVDEKFENGDMEVDITALGPPTRTMTSVGTFMGVENKVKVKLMRDVTSLAKYAWFIPGNSTGSVNRPWITGDKVYGGFHSNQFLVVDGDPTFYGKVTTLKGIQDQAKKPYYPSNPEFKGGYQEGIKVDWTKSMHYPDYATIASDGVAMGGDCSFNKKDLWLTFNADGTVTYASATNAGNDITKYPAPVTVPLETMAPNNLIYNKGGDVYVSGVLNGQVTIVAEGSSGAGLGNVYLVGDMVYETDPMIPNGEDSYMVNPDCDDLMGIIATNNIIVSTSNKANNLGGYANNVANPDIHIDAGVFCNSGGFIVEDLGKSPANVPLGSIYLQGSMTAGKEESVAQFNGNIVTAGYNRHVIFDQRFATGPPIWFAYITYYRAVSWLE